MCYKGWYGSDRGVCRIAQQFRGGISWGRCGFDALRDGLAAAGFGATADGLAAQAMLQRSPRSHTFARVAQHALIRTLKQVALLANPDVKERGAAASPRRGHRDTLEPRQTSVCTP